MPAALKLQFRVAEPGWSWSGAAAVEAPGEFLVKIRHRNRGETLLLQLDVAAASSGSSIVATLSGRQGGFAPYRLDNCSCETIHVQQAGCVEQEDVLQPYSSLPFAWDEPSAPHRVLLFLPGHRPLGEFALEQVGQSRLVPVPSSSRDNTLSHKSHHKRRALLISTYAEGPMRVLRVLDTRSHLLQQPGAGGLSGLFSYYGARSAAAAAGGAMALALAHAEEGAWLTLGSFERAHTMVNTDALVQVLGRHYILEAYQELPKVLASLDIFGDPARLLQALGLGFWHLLTLPAHSARWGPYRSLQRLVLRRYDRLESLGRALLYHTPGPFMAEEFLGCAELGLGLYAVVTVGHLLLLGCSVLPPPAAASTAAGTTAAAAAAAAGVSPAAGAAAPQQQQGAVHVQYKRPELLLVLDVRDVMMVSVEGVSVRLLCMAGDHPGHAVASSMAAAAAAAAAWEDDSAAGGSSDDMDTEDEFGGGGRAAGSAPLGTLIKHQLPLSFE
ncbi:hypothetical protein OEZ86_004465 [Tetradesmus obliquus]|nr:hypothetical protein OEZ86_004465 [Tetradesmus obliquus]